MKDKEKKPHKGESVIGKIIYGFLLFAPLISIGITCLVNIFNNSQTSKVIYKYNTNEVYSTNDLKPGNMYHFEKADNEYFTLNTKHIENINFNPEYPTGNALYFTKLDTNYDLNAQYTLRITSNSSYKLAVYLDKNGTWNTNMYQIGTNYEYEFTLSFDFVYQLKETGGYDNNFNISYISKCENIPIQRVENNNNNDIFYYGIEQVENSELFNWSKNSIIYTGMYEFTQALNVTNTFIPMLLTYWLLISVIYFLYDIVLMLVLIIHDKIHCLQDSI